MFKPTKSRLYVMASTTSVALMCGLSVSNASAQGSGPPLPPLPPIAAGESAPTAPASSDSSDALPTAAPDPVPEKSTTSPVPVSLSRVMGSRVRRSGRTLHVDVSCGRSGAVTVSRKSRQIGRRTFVCPATGSAVVRVRLTNAGATRLRAGATVRVTVRAGDQRHTRRMRVRVGRATRASDNAASRTLARASSTTECSSSYWSDKVGFRWQTSSQWAEYYCSELGALVGYHIVHRWPLYFYNFSNETWEYYGEWRQWTQDGTLRYWSATAGAW